MKLHVLSDVHLEFAPFDPPGMSADVLVLAGDIGTKKRGLVGAQAWSAGRPVLYVFGNHEYYGESLPRWREKIVSQAAGSTIQVLENQAVELNGIRFLGCTLWTDFEVLGKQHQDRCMREAADRMNDYKRITLSPVYRKLRVLDTLWLHRQSVAWLQARLNEPYRGPTVVITHHAPSLQSLGRSEHVTGDLRAAYTSNLEWLMGEKVKVWIHGHTHTPVDYKVKGTRVVSNPRGYPDEDVAGFDPGLTIDV